MGILDNPEVLKIGIEDCGEEMEILGSDEFVLEPMYFKWGHNKTPEMSLRSGVISKLREARKNLNMTSGCEKWDIKIWDSFRTLRTQKLLYDDYWKELVKDHPDWSDEQLRKQVEVFVSPPSQNPKLPAPHNTGGAIDLTLIDESGEDVEMGTAFDTFDVRSYTDHFSDSKDDGGGFHKNRMLLKKVLEEVGFANYHEEWWHFSYGDQEWARQRKQSMAIYGSVELS